MTKVLICDQFDKAGMELLKKGSVEVDYKPSITPEELKAVIGGYDGVIVRSRTKVRQDVISLASRLKVIGRAGVGLDNIDLKAAEARNIKVVNAPEALTNAVAELIIGDMIALVRDIYKATSTMKSGVWAKAELMGSELSGKTLGVVGFGRIGRSVARIAKAMNMKILAYDVIPIDEKTRNELGVQQKDLLSVIKEADFITLHVPASPETKHLINREKLGLMKRNAYIINASRGDVVDQEDLVQALKTGLIKGAALDVYEVEPPTSKELLSLANVILTPHIGGETTEAQLAAATITAQKVLDVLNG